MSKTIEMLKSYAPTCEQEIGDKNFFIECEEKEQILTRENTLCHLTSSAFIINKDKTKVLCIYHNIYNSWGWVGGHADGMDNMLEVALKEAKEETSLSNIKVLSNTPIAIDSISVQNHFKKGKFVAGHVHLNITYLLEADENEQIKIKPDENSNIAWLTFDELLTKSSEPHMIKIYQKIINQIKKNYL